MSYLPKTVLITGATGDFGKEFAKRFLAAGSKVVLHGRDPAKLEALKAEMKGDNIHTVCFNIADLATMTQAIGNLPVAFQDIDLLINNAGGAMGLGKFHEGLVEDYTTMIDSNVTGLVQLTHAILPGMVKRQRGHVINIGSAAGNWPYPGGHVYCAAKAFVKQFSMALRGDLQGTHVRVTNIEPGMVQTQFSLVRFKGDKEKADAVYANTTPLKAEDIGEAVFWTACLPPHVNINALEVMPTAQSFGPLAVERSA